MKQKIATSIFSLTGLFLSSFCLFAAEKEGAAELPHVDIEVYYIFDYPLGTSLAEELSRGREEVDTFQKRLIEASETLSKEQREGTRFSEEESLHAELNHVRRVFFQALMKRVKHLKRLSETGEIELVETSALNLIEREPQEPEHEFLMKEGLPGGIYTPKGPAYDIEIFDETFDTETTRREALSFKVTFFYHQGTDPFGSLKILPEEAYAPGTKVHEAMELRKTYLEKAHESMTSFYEAHGEIIRELADQTQSSSERGEPAFCVNNFELLDFISEMKAYSENPELTGPPGASNVALMQEAMQALQENQGISPEDLMARMQESQMLSLTSEEEPHLKETNFFVNIAELYNTSPSLEESWVDEIDAAAAAEDEAL